MLQNDSHQQHFMTPLLDPKDIWELRHLFERTILKDNRSGVTITKPQLETVFSKVHWAMPHMYLIRNLFQALAVDYVCDYRLFCASMTAFVKGPIMCFDVFNLSNDAMGAITGQEMELIIVTIIAIVQKLCDETKGTSQKERNLREKENHKEMVKWLQHFGKWPAKAQPAY
ncbi:hypothetical protein EDD86DRAFT_247090 [Gorgonomyces haynaldii]|nr:hypothetical protein EDD86DRAFT_247090 [Gorgonomyces haynaldii]